MYAEKLAKIWKVDEYVVLSPRTLAEYIGGGRVTPHTETEWDELWRHLPEPGVPVEAIARPLARMFNAALDHPHHSPRGPMALMSPTLRALVRTFVRGEAFRATRVLRERQVAAEPDRLRERRDYEPLVLPDEGLVGRLDAAVDRRRVGEPVTGVVVRVKPYGVFVDLGDIVALMHVSEHAASARRSTRSTSGSTSSSATSTVRGDASRSGCRRSPQHHALPVM